jgi:hypothetical protein
LDSGFSENFLHRWWKYRIQHEEGHRPLSDLVEDAHHLSRGPLVEFEILVPFHRATGINAEVPPRWQAPSEVSAWLKENEFDPRELRQVGGFLLSVRARDVFAATEQVFEIVERLAARVDLGTSLQFQAAEHVWIKGEPEPFPLRRSRRGVKVRALARENQLYAESALTNIDAALELLGPLEEGPPGPAVSGGWAAVEALLLGPGDTGDRGVAGDRLASLVACSYPRAELTTLAYAHLRNAEDALATEIQSAPDNQARAVHVAQAIESGQPLILSLESDRLAERRLKALLAEPKRTLRDIEQYAARTFRRLYRQRNLVLHWGRMNAVCLRAALRTAAPLVGAGVDRIAHAWFADGTNPLELSARARLRLELLGSQGGASPIDLLETLIDGHPARGLVWRRLQACYNGHIAELLQA